jgi:hypothetical protein
MAKSKSVVTTPAPGAGPLITDEERRRMIAEAAYLRSLERGGDPVDNWLVAERKINATLPNATRQKEEVALYIKLREAVRAGLEEVRGVANAEEMREVFDKAVERIKQTGEHTADSVNRVAASLRKDIAAIARKMGPKWEKFSDKSADLFSVWRDKGKVLLAQAAVSVGEWLQRTGTQVEHATYHTGEIAAAGTFECSACGSSLELTTPSHLPQCINCRGMEYRRVK